MFSLSKMFLKISNFLDYRENISKFSMTSYFAQKLFLIQVRKTKGIGSNIIQLLIMIWRREQPDKTGNSHLSDSQLSDSHLSDSQLSEFSLELISSWANSHLSEFAVERIRIWAKNQLYPHKHVPTWTIAI